MRVRISQLNHLVKKAIRYYGYNQSETKTIFDILMYAQLRGNNQGIVKLIGKGIPKNPKEGKIKVVKQTKLSARLDGRQNMGMIAVSKAVEMALKKAKQHGFGIVGTFNTASSTGAIGYYAQKIAQKGMIGFVFAGSPPTVTTHGSYEPLFGTNPLAIGIPSATQPIVLDMATAAMAYFGLVQAKTAGKKIPGDVAYDSKGKLTTDPGKAMDGAILPFDRNYKGAGLALVVQALCGPLVGGGFIDNDQTDTNWGNLVFVIDPDLLGNRQTFKAKMTKLMRRVKKAKKLKGVKEIYLPGERGNSLAAKRLKSGYIEVENNLYHALETVVANA
ncbi:MAG TPA: Ldh family oxidoreductase [Patescibacteria group bacterium]|nr:Ldh family oxidoreductase [Patescibacteria group bacterium]